jgi:hypothetical protein
MKTIDSFRDSVAAAAPPAGLAPSLQALWWLRKGDWNAAHNVCQNHEDNDDCNWVHAHLHRQEGDLSNAGGWYCRAGKEMKGATLEEEWDLLAAEFLARSAV